jgi:lysophospholipase L1-like esterase
MRPGFLIAAVMLACLPARGHAQQTPPPVPVQSNVPKDAPLNPKLPTLFIVGDSTARNGADLGWGDHFAALFDTRRINIANRARAGRSSRTYYNEGLWDAVVAQMKPGDFVLIQMGHNDGGSGPDGVVKDAKGRSSIKGLGEETVDVPIVKPYTSGPLAGKTTETVHTYGWYVRKYIADTRARGATPILLTVTIRNIWKDQRIERDMGFREVETQIATAEHVPLADMATLEADFLEEAGPDRTGLLFPIDHTHTSAQGAELNARFVARALQNIHSPVADYLAADLAR